jgi:hypothetical protein
MIITAILAAVLMGIGIYKAVRFTGEASRYLTAAVTRYIKRKKLEAKRVARAAVAEAKNLAIEAVMLTYFYLVAKVAR